jgi:hypothetical protein
MTEEADPSANFFRLAKTLRKRSTISASAVHHEVWPRYGPPNRQFWKSLRIKSFSARMAEGEELDSNLLHAALMGREGI